MVLVDKTLDGTTFIVFITLAYNILTPAKAISKASYAIKKGDAAAERVLEILEASNELTDHPNAKPISGFNSEVRFDKIGFRYDTTPVLKAFSLNLKKGQTISLF